MSNGYLIAAGNDVAAAHEISDGFGLDVIDAASMDDPNNAASALAAAANVGLLISSASASDAHYVAVLRAVAQHLQRVQLILVDADARAAFDFLPETWPSMTLEDARGRAAELVRRRDASPGDEPDRAAPIPAAPEPEAPTPEPTPEPEASAPEPEAPPQQAEAPAEPDAHAPIEETPREGAAAGDDAVAERAPPEDAISQAGPEPEPAASEADATPKTAEEERQEEGAPPLASAETEQASPSQAPPQAEPPPQIDQPAPAPPPDQDLSAPNDSPSALGGARAPPEIPLPAPMPAPASAPSPPSQASSSATTAAPPAKARGRADASEASAPADATAFAPKKLRRGAPELVQVTIHQPKDLKTVIQAAKKANPSADPAPQGVHIGDVALGASIGVALEAHGAACDGAMQRRPWRGDPIDFSFSVEAEGEAKKAVFIARVFIDDAQIGVIGFTRPISGPKKRAADTGDGARLKRHKRVFLSYSSPDRETVSAIATAYAAAGVPHFWDRASLKSGEEWSPRLRKEIDRADLFHLCWSKSAAQSQWVEKETEHALTRRRRSKGKNPDITVQMLDGPPWAPHPRELDAINFDDFVRAAIVGYARGDGST